MISYQTCVQTKTDFVLQYDALFPAQRADLLAALQQHQVSPSEQEQFTSISAMQTEGHKKRKLSSIKVSRKKRRLEKKKAKDLQLDLENDSEDELANEGKNSANLNVVGLKVSNCISYRLP